jgi:hypothetical protein
MVMKKICFAVLFLSLAVCSSVVYAAPRKTVISPEPKREYNRAPESSDTRTGLGFNTQLTGNSGVAVNSLSLRFWTSENFGLEPILGFYFGDNITFFDLGFKFLSSIKKEENLRCYWYGLLGLENWKIGSQSDTDMTIAGGLGVEFFLQGLPNLGFGAEIGAGYNSGAKAFSTTAGLVSSVGMRYYFK